jgi:hypothetical protein
MPLSLRRRVLLLATLCSPVLAPAAESAWMGKANCRIAPIKAPSATDVSWTGACAEGYASGKGVLAWRENDGDFNIEATLVRGEVSGNVVMKTPGYTYKGTLQAGIPHGQGYFQFPSADGEYEGEVVAGRPHGKGEKLDAHRSYYTGEWAEGKRNGYGEAVFTVGGSYKGQWKDDEYHGKGTIVYAGSGRSYEGLFEDGRVTGLPAPEIEEGHYAIRVPRNGSHIREESVISKLPLTAGWNALTHAQKNVVRRRYPALQAGDDPPFPSKGEGGIFDAVRRIGLELAPVTGYLGVHVLVGKEGKPLSVTTYGAPGAGMVRAVSNLLMLQQYKPALCQGEPCEMVYPLYFDFSITVKGGKPLS